VWRSCEMKLRAAVHRLIDLQSRKLSFKTPILRFSGCQTFEYVSFCIRWEIG